MDYEGYIDNLNSPQLQQGLSELDKSLTSEQWANILLSLGLNDDASIKNASDSKHFVEIQYPNFISNPCIDISCNQQI
jgi:hypothetical protein